MTRAKTGLFAGGFRRLALAATLCSAALASAGCETAGIFADNSPQTAVAEQSAPAARKKTVAFAPIIGAPAQLSEQLAGSVATRVEQQQVPVVKTAGASADYTVRGYVVAAPNSAGTELSYIWDVLDTDDKRVHRITGKEVVQGPRQQDPWANVTPATLEGIATKTAAELASFIPEQPAPAAQAAAQAQSQTTATSSTPALQQQSTSGAALQATPAVANGSAVKTSATQANAPTSLQPQNAAQGTTGTTGQQVATAVAGPLSAVVPPVVGAPGDGSNTLAVALQRQLVRRGIRTAARGGANAYTVRGNVTMGPPTAGKQAIRIEWQVLDPTGKKVGTVSQKNTIPQGSLNGPWGATADAAAQAAVEGVVKLLPKETRTN